MLKVQTFCNNIIVFLSLTLLFSSFTSTFNISLCLVKIRDFRSTNLYYRWQKHSADLQNTVAGNELVLYSRFAFRQSPVGKKMTSWLSSS